MYVGESERKERREMVWVSHKALSERGDSRGAFRVRSAFQNREKESERVRE